MINPLWIIPAAIVAAFAAVLCQIARERMLFGVDPRIIGFIIVTIAMMVDWSAT